MKKALKRFLITIFVIATLILAGYGAVKLYNFVIEDATKKIKKGVADGVGGALNPLSWPGRLFGHKSN
jgi:hypothetical protein